MDVVEDDDAVIGKIATHDTMMMLPMSDDERMNFISISLSLFLSVNTLNLNLVLRSTVISQKRNRKLRMFLTLFKLFEVRDSTSIVPNLTTTTNLNQHEYY